mgnify:CR=1 FL=1
MTLPEPDRTALPTWSDGTVATLSTIGDGPHAIPVSTGVRASDSQMLIALATRRGSLANLKADPRVAITFLAEGNVAVTVHGQAEVVAEPMACSDRVCAVLITAERIRDHGQPRFEIEAGVAWRWTEEDAEQRDAEVRAELSEIAASIAAG